MIWRVADLKLGWAKIQSILIDTIREIISYHIISIDFFNPLPNKRVITAIIIIRDQRKFTIKMRCSGAVSPFQVAPLLQRALPRLSKRYNLIDVINLSMNGYR